MTKKDLRFVTELYRGKDERGETYYFTIIAKDKEGSEVLLLSHENNKSATGSKLLLELAKHARKDYSELIIKEYRAYSAGSTGATQPIQVHEVLLKQNNKPAKMDEQIIEMFGGMSGFGNFREKQGINVARLESLQRELVRSENEKEQLLTKLGDYEANTKKLEFKIADLRDKIKDLTWEHEDKMRKLTYSHDDELRKYKGQNAIIQAGVQGIGGLLVKKLNISDADLQGLLGMDAQPKPQSQNNNSNDSAFNEVEVEPENLSPEQQYIKKQADSIHKWMLTANRDVTDKIYAVFKSITSSEENLNDFYELANQDE